MEINIPKEERKFKERPTVVTVHGFQGWMQLFSRGVFWSFGTNFATLPATFRKYTNTNVIECKWRNGFFYGYEAAIEAAEGVGRKIAKYLNDALGDDLVLWKNLTIVGNSLGVKTVIIIHSTLFKQICIA